MIQQIRQFVIPHVRQNAQMAGKPFGADEERLVVERYLVER